MAVLDSTQFNQLVQQVREALLAGSQGVGEIEVVTSLANLVSLPALRLIGASESVVEAPLELLSAPAVEAAADARKATEDAVVAAVNAAAAADLSEAERKDLDEIKLRSIVAGTDAFAKGDTAFAGAINTENATLYAMQMASHLQTKLEQAQVVILSGQASQDVIDNMNEQVQNTILVCADTREEAYSAILQLRTLQLQLSQAIVAAYVTFDSMQLSTAAARQATDIAYWAAAKIEALSERAERVIVESVLHTGEAKQTVIRLEDLEKGLLFAKSAADIAAAGANKNADLAKRIAEATEQARSVAVLEADRAKEATGQAEKAAAEALFSASGADNAAGHANEKAERADSAAERAAISKQEADIAAAAALAAEQRAIEASKAAENIVSGIRPDWSVADKTSSNYIANKPETPTLDFEPDSGTLTYINRDGTEVSYRTGDEVRVYDKENNCYDFYKLYDILEGRAVWDTIGSGTLPVDVVLTGANYFNESVKVIKGGVLE